jgi:hypothetical protein
MTASSSLNDRLSTNSGGLTKFVALHGTKIGMTVGMVTAVVVLGHAVAFAVTSNPTHMLDAAKAAIGIGGGAMIFAGGSKLTNMLARETNPEWFVNKSHEKDGVTTIEPGPSAMMEAKAMISSFGAAAQKKFVELSRGTVLESIIPKAIMDKHVSLGAKKDSGNELGM